jgi:capsular polysaccharide transport system permease protein
MVADYLTSRQVVDEANQRINVIARFSRPEIDWWSRFDRTKPMESFVSYWQEMVKSKFDQMTGVGSVQVRAFTPDDAQLIAKTLTTLAEELINSMTVRGHRDSIAFAESEVRRAEDRVKAVRAKMTVFRNRVGVIDPASSVVASNSTLVQTLRAELAKLETSLATLRQQRLDESSPTVKALQSQIDATKQQLDSLGSQIGESNSGNVLTKDVAEYEQLMLEKLFAENVLTSAMQALVVARANATNQRLYVSPYVQAGRPESSTYPKRLYSILMVAFGAFVVWTLLIMLTRSVREHLA